MIFAAAPVTIFTEPATVIRDVPLGQVPRLVCTVNFAAVVVVPFPFFHVIFEPSDPFEEPGGGVFRVTAEPPALNAAGVHTVRIDVAVDPTSFVVSLPHATLDVAAPDGIANGNMAKVPTAAATAMARAPTEFFI